MFKQSERICSAARSPSNHMKSPRKLILSKLRLYASFERRVNQNFAYELGSCIETGDADAEHWGIVAPVAATGDLPLTAPSPERLLRGCGDRLNGNVWSHSCRASLVACFGWSGNTNWPSTQSVVAPSVIAFAPSRIAARRRIGVRNP